ncbi:helix-turn-helix transcriptional regulator [Aeribacillus composti]|jgi:transcriptional regulator with XRE-family HTH domain|uniref:Helix-turn-helix transcriptional regulator n=1 Tax=Aeribacillus composti TaxID=1868734 RepID=A0ABY9W616_9BACI|nr:MULTISPECIES: helix-turn-helix transcriptional regulator [Aeribacillus]RZI50274.1 XRE family transcriptional regulator [Aeribacillus pallidus]WNF31609.1 helix-turn-helix transcriptional regulator [Aeribacillus composti]
MNYGDRLKKLRESKRLSQQQLADKLNINRSTYARYELGQTQPDFETLEKLADFFEVSIDYLLGRTDDPSNKYSDYPTLIKEDEKDIAKDLEKIINSLENGDGYSHFDGQSIKDLDAEDRKILIAFLENSLRLGKRLTKQKLKKHWK